MAKRALVIGNSDGIGLAMTRRLLAEGWQVAGLSRSPSPLSDPHYDHTVVDVTALEYQTVLAQACGSGAPELCVYCVGIGELTELTDLAPQTRVLEVNLLAAARTLEVIIPRLLHARTGHVIALSSLADSLLNAQAVGYSASKAGLTSLLFGLTLALRPHGVAVTTVRFGFVDTKMAKGPIRPRMVSVDRAVDVLMRAVRTRPAVVSYPRSMALLAGVVRFVSLIRLRLGRASSRR